MAHRDYTASFLRHRLPHTYHCDYHGLHWQHMLRFMPCCDLQARSVGDEQQTDGLRASVKIMSLQIAITKQLQQLLAGLRRQQQQRGAEATGPAGVSKEQLEGLLKEIQNSSMDISELYNAYAQPLEMWDMCLEICNFAGNVPAEYVRQLWDLLLKETWEEGVAAGGLDTDSQLERCCDKVQALGVKFYPNESRSVGTLPCMSCNCHFVSIIHARFCQILQDM